MSRALQLLLAIICLCSWRTTEIVARSINPSSDGNNSIRPSMEGGVILGHSLVAPASLVPFPQDPSAFQTQWFPQESATAQRHSSTTPSQDTNALKVLEPTTMMSSNIHQTQVFGRRLKRQQTTTTTTTEKPPTVLQQYFQDNPDGTYEQR